MTYLKSIFILATIFLFFSCSLSKPHKEPLTKSLFFQSSEIELLTNSQGNGNILTMKIDTNDSIYINNIDKNNRIKSINEVQELNEVVVVNSRKNAFTIQKDNTLEIPFAVRIPKNLLNENWRLTIIPSIHINDTILHGLPIYLKGIEFKNFQIQCSEKYDTYLKSIVPKEKYDSAFLDIKNVTKDIKYKQESFYKEYSKIWNEKERAKNWYKNQEKSYNKEVTKDKAKLQKKKDFQNILAIRKVEANLLKGKDTTNVFKNHMQRIEDKIKEYEETLDTLKIPKRINKLLHSEVAKNNQFTKSDSLFIVTNRYFRDRILINENLLERLEKEKQNLMPFPDEENFYVDSIISQADDVLMDYIYLYPIEKEVNNIYVTANAYVDAIDNSSFQISNQDTIFYSIASLSQLANNDLAYKEQIILPRAENLLTLNIKFGNNQELDLLSNKDEIDKINSLISNINVVGYQIDSISISTLTDLSNSYEVNSTNSIEQANNIKKYFSTIYKGNIITEPKSENWQGLLEQIKSNPNIKEKEIITNLLLRTNNPDITKSLLKKKYPQDYKIIADQIYPTLNKQEIMFYLTYPNYIEGTTEKKIEIKGYLKGLEYLREKKYEKALEILYPYQDYNSALCLVALKINNKAKEILEKITPTSDSEYLLAIISVRLNDKEKIISHLKNAIRLNPEKKNRIKLDYELNDYIMKNKITL